MESLTEAVECVLEGTANSKECRFKLALQENNKTVEDPSHNSLSYEEEISEAHWTCVEGAFWLGARLKGYSWVQASMMLIEIKLLFISNYGVEMIDTNDDRGRDEAVAKLKDLL